MASSAPRLLLSVADINGVLHISNCAVVARGQRNVLMNPTTIIGRRLTDEFIREWTVATGAPLDPVRGFVFNSSIDRGSRFAFSVDGTAGRS